ncbi:MAG: alpha/beta hydrolase fold domain-containing protein, partial [Lachnospiraceae bacterium]|nr:alpha/beta hydrolase fold domain-containing protein [Lachnospiraceae bacterium]
MPIPALIIDTMRQAPRLYEMTVDEVRQVFIDQGKAAPPLPYAGQIEERTLTTAHRETPVRIYRMTQDEAAPVLVYFHGGGMLFGDLNFMDAPCRYISEHASCTVISVDYALAPENKFPKPLEECYEAVREIVRNAAELKIDPSRLALGG